jgi:formamidopyrimidine-DNA glycosylase
MPEIPDLESYAEALRPRIVGARLENIRIKNPFFLRTVEPPLEAVLGRTVTDVRRFQKRILIELEGRMFLLIHLMIAGRLHWYPGGKTGSRRAGIATFVMRGKEYLVGIFAENGILRAETSCNFYWGSRWVHRSFDDLEQAYYLLDTAMEKLKAAEKSQIPKSKSQ